MISWYQRKWILPFQVQHSLVQRMVSLYKITMPSCRQLVHHFYSFKGFPGGSDGEESACSAGDLGSIPGLGGCPGEGNGYPLQYSCLGNPMDRGAWWAPWGYKESDTTKHTHILSKVNDINLGYLNPFPHSFYFFCLFFNICLFIWLPRS